MVCSSIAAFLNYLHRMCVEGLVRPALHGSTVMGHSSSGSLRSPCGFQCFPLEEIIQGADADRSFRIDPRSCEQASPVIRHWVSVCISSSALIHVHGSIQSHRSVTFILLRACLPDLAVWGTPHLVRFSPDLMAHHRSRIGSLVGWGLPVTLSAPTPLLGSGKVCVARGGS